MVSNVVRWFILGTTRMNISRRSFRAQKYYIHSAKKKLFGKDLPLQPILFLQAPFGYGRDVMHLVSTEIRC